MIFSDLIPLFNRLISVGHIDWNRKIHWAISFYLKDCCVQRICIFQRGRRTFKFICSCCFVHSRGSFQSFGRAKKRPVCNRLAQSIVGSAEDGKKNVCKFLILVKNFSSDGSKWYFLIFLNIIHFPLLPIDKDIFSFTFR